ncbi:MAG: bleomycin resistance protein [Segetibacter sp.]|nr:bleomycin resistance protein [Segetibacter sp.]
MNETNNTVFAPQLFIRRGVTNIDFYTKALGAIEHRRWTNDDGSIHVAELSIDGAMFHIHEESLRSGSFSPEKHNGTTATIGLFVPDVDSYMSRAIEAGAIEISPAQDYDYGYRQGEIKDPFGHRWLIEMKI